MAGNKGWVVPLFVYFLQKLTVSTAYVISPSFTLHFRKHNSDSLTFYYYYYFNLLLLRIL